MKSKDDEKVVKKKLRDAPKLEGYYFSPERAREVRDNGQILSIRVETSLKCNLRCSYCYSAGGKALPNEIKYEEIIDVINQAKDLKAESIVIIGGGEPTIYPRFRDLVKYVHSINLIPVIFTNNQTMTKDLAQFLLDHNVSVIIKLDSLDEKIQDEMSCVKGAYKNIMRGLQNLIDVGYLNFKDEQRLKLGASFLVNKQNAPSVPAIWKFCRDRKIFPNLEMMIPNERGDEVNNLLLSREEWKKLKLQLLELDRSEYGYDWLPYTPLLASGCFQVMYNLYITVEGFVRPCSDIQVNIANIKNYSLKEIIELPFFKRARNIDKYLQGKCRNCEHLSQCIGCRGLAFTTSRDNDEYPFEALCREDPSCFK